MRIGVPPQLNVISAEHTPSTSHERAASGGGIFGKLLKLLPCSGNGIGVEMQRDALLNSLGEIREHFGTLRSQNWSPDQQEFDFDRAMLPLLIRAENNRHGNAPITYTTANSIASLASPESKQVLFNVPLTQHMVAADIRMVNGNLSAIVIEPLYQSSTLRNERVIDMLESGLPPNARVSVLAMDAQKSVSGCRIFALSAAHKLAKDPEWCSTLHMANMTSPQAFAQASGAELEQVHSKITLFNARQSASIQLMKHAQARSSLVHWAADKGGDAALAQPVNKRGLSLQERFDEHTTSRYTIKEARDGTESLHKLNMSASIEDKRLQYIDRAMAYLATAPKQVIRETAAQFDRDIDGILMPSQKGLKLNARAVGPYDSIAPRLS
ncbi:YopJ family acetyltransferase [Pseudomonas indica]|uniref:YopJ family acetyltransferase n=1 Tax=Pseudomonas indica TaxID=137658 RepID=UPI0023F87D83|nr:YopJ family acetyltransferase [Pseudomonas indica]MBU3056992.1 hypothetical protein [Pseudomonas indica]